MKSRRPYPEFRVVLSLCLALVLALGGPGPALAGMEDTAMFYNELSQYGQWVEYEHYGPVWIPSQVEENWRPYTNGRWVPTEQGYVFETQEPWGWATYHYGNWMPTPTYGWVWVPGRTWYPSTVDWRTTPEDTPKEAAYVGWAPIPPPDYVPPPSMPAFEPAGGYYPGSPVTDLISSPFYVFAQAASFLLGLGQAFTPSYSYVNVGVLAPPAYVPVLFPTTMIVPNYVTPAYYPPMDFIGLGAPGAILTAYNAGPPVNYISRVTNVSQTVINQNITNNTVNITKINNVVAPTNILNQNTAIKNITPTNLVQGKPLPPPNPCKDTKLASANLGKPNVIKTPDKIPPIKDHIPKALPVPPGTVKGAVGTGLPSKATQPLTPKMAQQIEKLPPGQKIVPEKAPKPPVPTVKPAVPGEKPVTPGVKPAVPGVKPTVPGEKPAVPGVKPAVPGEKPPTKAVKPAVPGEKPAVPGVKPTVPGEKPPTKAVKPTTPGVKPAVPGEKPPTPGVKPTTPAAKPPTPAAPSQQQQQLQQQKQREQQLQQQKQREQQQQQQRQREQQLQQQKQREQQQQRQREQQLQQQRQREQQQQRQREQQLQQQRQREQQQRQQQLQQQQQQQQQQRQREQQAAQQKQREKEAREKAERERQQREQQQREQQQRQQQRSR